MSESTEKLINTILDAGLSIAERENLSLTTKGPAKDNHLTIVGGVRRVEFYTNGTVYSNRVKGKFKPYRLKGTPASESVHDAIRVALTGK